MNHCLRHYEEAIAGVCRACQQPFCARCLVYSFGPKKPPFCLGCALYASGIRNGTRQITPPPDGDQFGEHPGQAAAAASLATDKRAERSRRRAEREAIKGAEKAARRAARASKSAPPAPEALPVEPARGGRVPAPSVLQASATTAQPAAANPFS
ncbi:MAG: hypothetical protein JWM47_3294 [Acidimicrobiales bacterium]|nr:hypothetical protein [Acidimicrobiales bacterium]